MSIIDQLHPLLQETVRQLAVKLARCAVYDRERIDRLITNSPYIGTTLAALGHKGAAMDVQRQLIAAAIVEEQRGIPDTPQEDEPLLTDDYLGIIHCAARQMLCHMDDEQYKQEVERDLYDAVMRKALADTGCSAEACSRAMTGCAMLEHVTADLLESCAGDATVH